MKKLKMILLLATLLVLLAGVASASEVSTDTTTNTDSITEKTSVEDTATLSSRDTAIVNKLNKNIQTDKDSENYINKSQTKTLSRNTEKTNIKKEDSSINNWQQLQTAVTDAERETEKNIILTLGEATYTNTGTITWNNPDIVLTIDGNGQTIDGNQNQLFFISPGASLVLKNINLQNARSKYGGAIYNNGILNITNTTFTKNSANYGGGAIESITKLTLTVKDSTFSENQVTGFGSG